MTLNEISAKRIQLSAEFSRDMRELGEIKKRKAFEIIRLRAGGDCKSYADAERQFEITVDGQKEIELTFKCKGLEKLISSLNTEIRLKMAEGYNNFADSQY